MEYINVGKIITTHGLHGEVKIRSSFKYKDKVFVTDNNLYLGEDKKPVTICSYRLHQSYDMIVFAEINDIDDAIKYKNIDVFINKEMLLLDKNECLNEDLLGMEVSYQEKSLGVVKRVFDAGFGNEIMEIIGKKRVLIPKNEHFIAEIDIKLRKMTLKNVKGMI